ncbi:hypothetical protein [Spirosoma linguale]|uniref:Uncharacterized protein n=1 Tax=Spirosoma linguale (strain ATCC 33905 / DSM 74 / LMG 10896 / Claus 1) TaxID=504472 RepID=D2QV99_SPILD|nr:hypothetical protein Slin_6779 [Spirosoma linguale DSM 74]
MKPIRSSKTEFRLYRDTVRSTRRVSKRHRTIRFPFVIEQTSLLLVCWSISLVSCGQILQVRDAKGTIRATFGTGDQLQIVFQPAPSAIRTVSGQLRRVGSDSLTVVNFSGDPQGVAGVHITGLRRLPTVLNGLTAGVALGATAITLIDKRELPPAPQVAVSLLIGAGIGAGVTHWQRSRHPKRVRHRSERGWSFQVR